MPAKPAGFFMPGRHYVSVTEADRIVAAGVPIKLLDGRTVQVRYGFRGLKMLEDTFGSIAAVQGVVQSVSTGKAFGPVADLLAAGLVAEGLSADDLLDALDPRLLPAYVDAFGAALEEAFPAPEEPDDSGKVLSTNGSPGPPSTTPAPSDSAAAKPTSGT